MGVRSRVVTLVATLGVLGVTTLTGPASGVSFTRVDEAFCLYALSGGGNDLSLQAMIRADFAELHVSPTNLEAEIAVYASEDGSTATLSTGMARRAPSAQLRRQLERIAQDATALAALTRRLGAAVRDYAASPGESALSAVTVLENRYLARAAADDRTAPFNSSISAIDTLCLPYERAFGVAEQAVFVAIKAAGDGPLTPARIQQALRTPEYRSDTLVAAGPHSRVTSVTMLVDGYRVCLAIGHGVSLFHILAC